MKTAPVINGYEILDRLDSGGMGSVYRARQISLEREVALKIVHSHLLSDQKAVERFLREGKLAARLEHPNIVRIHELGRNEEGQPFLSMELLRGMSLKDYLAKGPMPAQEAVTIACQVLDALTTAHAAGVMHRDVKPGNVHIGQDGVARLLDFGIAHAFDLSHLSSTGATAGTPYYMSPEQAKGQPSDHRGDLYSVGVLLYEMLTGKVPFEGDTPLVVAMQHAQTPPPPLPKTFPVGLRNFMEQALAKDRGKRFQSALEMKQALLRASQDLSVVRAGSAVAAVPSASFTTLVKDKSVRWPLTIFLAAGIFLICLLLAMARLNHRVMIAPPPAATKPVSSLPPSRKGPEDLSSVKPRAALLAAPVISNLSAKNSNARLTITADVQLSGDESLDENQPLELQCSAVGPITQKVFELGKGTYHVVLSYPRQLKPGVVRIEDVILADGKAHDGIAGKYATWSASKPSKSRTDVSKPKARIHGKSANPAMMKCPFCGKLIPRNATFCGWCGKKLPAKKH